ncbi:MAG: hypothetical protein J3Q66DRAFT_102497 [Benniella sp.]|nr:MAG: hypothetical protein J3Q66DRAFT_102497 [Benniella sp.]
MLSPNPSRPSSSGALGQRTLGLTRAQGLPEKQEVESGMTLRIIRRYMKSPDAQKPTQDALTTLLTACDKQNEFNLAKFHSVPMINEFGMAPMTINHQGNPRFHVLVPKAQIQMGSDIHRILSCIIKLYGKRRQSIPILHNQDLSKELQKLSLSLADKIVEYCGGQVNRR